MGLDMYLTRRNKAKELEVEIYYWRKFLGLIRIHLEGI